MHSTARAGLRPAIRVLALGLATVVALLTGGLPALATTGTAGPRPVSEMPAISALGQFDLPWQAPSRTLGSREAVGASQATDAVYPAHIQEALADVWSDDLDIPDGEVFVGADGERIDAPRLEGWLAERGSPLAAYARDLVAAGNRHEVDPRLVVGIAVIESSAGQHLPPGSHNAWGWHGGGSHGLAAWGSWPESIEAFTEGLARVYDTDQVDERMARTYVPPNWRTWLRTVRWVIDDI